MRLICPNCSAQYEVPADVIPAEGRDVQCSNCQETWFQTHPDTEQQSDIAQTLKEHFEQTEPETTPEQEQPDKDLEPDPIDDEFERSLEQEIDVLADEDANIAPAITHERTKREIAPPVADILKEEAQREREQRAAEAFENQDEFALNVDEPTSDQQPKRSGYIDPKLDGLDELYKETASNAPASRRDLLPDIEEINSTLRRDKKSTPKAETDTIAQKNASARRGFRAAVILLLIAVIVYVYADMITSNLPPSTPHLNAYVAQIDQWRAALSDHTTGFLTWLQTQADQARARSG